MPARRREFQIAANEAGNQLFLVGLHPRGVIIVEFAPAAFQECRQLAQTAALDTAHLHVFHKRTLFGLAKQRLAHTASHKLFIDQNFARQFKTRVFTSISKSKIC